MSIDNASAERDRLHVLDVLRGIALIGMFFVHFSDFSSGGGSADKIYQSFVALFFEERFWTMFAILFGVGFAIQLGRAAAATRSFRSTSGALPHSPSSGSSPRRSSGSTSC